MIFIIKVFATTIAGELKNHKLSLFLFRVKSVPEKRQKPCFVALELDAVRSEVGL
ncbi:hypothetical protein [uncultured Draconibacterium sp.]|uniref:hypothetical protein n=1 Tax=uncultured Draconibacterium sp. TaxID=1573823 RepID=UPI003216B1F0